jgi:hypothetical protein
LPTPPIERLKNSRYTSLKSQAHKQKASPNLMPFTLRDFASDVIPKLPLLALFEYVAKLHKKAALIILETVTLRSVKSPQNHEKPTHWHKFFGTIAAPAKPLHSLRKESCPSREPELQQVHSNGGV